MALERQAEPPWFSWRGLREDQGGSDNPEQEHFELDLPHGTVLTTPEEPAHPVNGRGVRGVSFRLQALPPHRFEVSASAKDLIFMIMRDALTNRQHNITTDGEIIETAETTTIDD